IPIRDSRRKKLQKRTEILGDRFSVVKTTPHPGQGWLVCVASSTLHLQTRGRMDNQKLPPAAGTPVNAKTKTSLDDLWKESLADFSKSFHSPTSTPRQLSPR